MSRRTGFVAAVMVILAVTAGTALASQETIWLTKERKDRVIANFASVGERLTAVSTAIDAAYDDEAKIGAVLYYDESGWPNYWRLADSFYNPLRELHKTLDTDLAHSQNGYNDPDVRKFLELSRTLSGAIERDAGNPDIRQRSSTLVRIQRELIPQAKDRMAKILPRLGSTDPEKYGALDETQAGAMYTVFVKMKNQLLNLKAKTSADLSVVRQGKSSQVIEHVKIGGIFTRNRWVLKGAYLNPIKGLLDQAFPLVGIVENRGRRGEAWGAFGYIKGNIVERVLIDVGDPDDGANLEGLLQLRDEYVPEALRLLEAEMAVFMQTAPNAQAIKDRVEASESGGTDVSASTEDTSGTGGTQEPAPVDTTGALLGQEPGEQTQQPPTTGSTSTSQSQQGSEAQQYTIKYGDSLGEITSDKLRQAFLAAGWSEDQLPDFWGDTGLVSALGRANGMDDWRGGTIYEGSTLTIPAVPAAPSDASQSSAAYEQWFQTLGSQGGATNNQQQTQTQQQNQGQGGVNNQQQQNQNQQQNQGQGGVNNQQQQQNQQQTQPPFGGRTVEQQIQRIKADAQSFYSDLFNRRNSPNTGEFAAFLAAECPRQRGSSNASILRWSCEVLARKIDEVAQYNNGKLPSDLVRLRMRLGSLHACLNGNPPYDQTQVMRIQNALYGDNGVFMSFY